MISRKKRCSSVMMSLKIESQFGNRLEGREQEGVDKRRKMYGPGNGIMLLNNIFLVSLFLVLLLSFANAKEKEGAVVGKTDAYQPRLTGLNRILNRLDQSSDGGGSDGGTTPPKSHHHPYHYPPMMMMREPETEVKVERRNLISSPQQANLDFGSSPYSKMSSNLQPAGHRKSGNTDPFNLKKEVGRVNEEEDDDEEDMDDDEDDFYDDDDDDEDDDEMEEDEKDSDRPLNDKLSSWAHKYRNRYASERGQQLTTTTTTSTTTPAPQPAYSYSQWKWQHLGSRQALDQTRREMASQHHHHDSSRSRHHEQRSTSHSSGSSASGQSYSATNRHQPPRSLTTEAVQHVMKVRREGECRIPKPRVIKVQDFYPHPSKTYVPHCTILHHCSDETGCCRSDWDTCAPKTTERVELAFYTVYLDQSNPRGSMVEKLVFYNHTECECRDKMDDMMPRDAPDPSPYNSDIPANTHNKPASFSKRHLSGHGKSQYEVVSSRRELSCSCPSAFSQRILLDGSCLCDCFDKDHHCLKQKRGRDFFPLNDKWCIQSGRCEVPECAYGPYIHLIGRCPRKWERSGQNVSWTRYLTNP